MQIPRGRDRVIREIMLTGVGAGPVGANLEVSVGVENCGEGQAGGFRLALIYMANLDMGEPYIKIEMKQFSPIMAGDALMVSFAIPAYPGTPDKGTLIAIADPSVSGHPAGAMLEGRLLRAIGGVGRTDINNVFGVIFAAEGHDLPLRWRNPAAQD
ncbi:MAG: hypothetical protein AB7Y46_15555 [Armatimonadota bacterium]